MDKVFLSYSFAPEPPGEIISAIETLLESHDIRPTGGEDIEGRTLNEGIKSEIAKCDGLVAVLSARNRKDNGRFLPTSWVMAELVHARAKEKSCIAIAYPDVDVEGPEAANERIPFNPARPSDALLKLSRTVGDWKRSRGRRAKVRILPPELLPLIQGDDRMECLYRLMREDTGERLNDWERAKLAVMPGGAFAFIPAVPADSLIQVKLQSESGTSWISQPTPQWLHVELAKR